MRDILVALLIHQAGLVYLPLVCWLGLTVVPAHPT